MTNIAEIVRQHGLWLEGHPGGEKANLRGLDLRSLDLLFVDLRFADFRDADLRFTNFRGADFRFADFRGADFRFADFRGADFRDAKLRGADLSYADFRDAKLRGLDLRIYQTDLWTCYIQADHIRIGCQYHTANEWRDFGDEKISKMHSEALSWWRVHKEVIFSIHNTLTTGQKENV